MTINITKLHPEATLPQYAHSPAEDAGMDLTVLDVDHEWHRETATRLNIDPTGGGFFLETNDRLMVRTGLAMEIPAGFEVQIRARSGLTSKHGITLINSPATIDPGYRGELKICLVNLSRKTYYSVRPGDRVAQMVVARYEAVQWREQELAVSLRGAGGFGSSGR